MYAVRLHLQGIKLYLFMCLQTLLADQLLHMAPTCCPIVTWLHVLPNRYTWLPRAAGHQGLICFIHLSTDTAGWPILTRGSHVLQGTKACLGWDRQPLGGTHAPTAVVDLWLQLLQISSHVAQVGLSSISVRVTLLLLQLSSHLPSADASCFYPACSCSAA